VNREFSIQIDQLSNDYSAIEVRSCWLPAWLLCCWALALLTADCCAAEWSRFGWYHAACPACLQEKNARLLLQAKELEEAVKKAEKEVCAAIL
jgi:hypothetical protein